MDTKSSRVAVLGLGMIGAQVARCLAAAGYEVYGVDPDNRARRAVADDVHAVLPVLGSAAEAIEVVLCSLPSPQIVADTMLSDGGLISELRRGACVVDLTTNSLEVGRNLVLAAQRHGLAVVDAPVSGMAPEMIIMVGAGEIGEPVSSIFSHISSEVFFLGEPLSGYVAKLLHQYVFVTSVVTAADVIGAGSATRLQLDRFIQVLMHGSASSTALRLFPEVSALGYDELPSASLAILLKDIRLVQEFNEVLGLDPDHVEFLVRRLEEGVRRHGEQAPIYRLTDK